MKILEIKETGASNTLLWAISNGANIKEDMPLVSLINDETCYLVTLGDINFFELFRLTQMYRDKLRIVNERMAAIPPMALLQEIFPGEYTSEQDSMSLAEVSENVIKNFMNLTSQMNADSDIIHPGAIRLFLPMITRKFDIQIPVSFIDFFQSMDEDEISKLFTPDYPGTLKEIIEADVHGVKTILSTGIVRWTQILKFDKRYDQYVKLIKYATLKSYPNPSKLYKFGLIGFSKKDNISRGEVRCNLFKANQNIISNTMTRLSRMNTPLELDFAIQLPIQYMQLLENSFNQEVLPIQYQSSMTSIIEGGLNYFDFKTPEYENPDSEEGKEKVEMHNNAIEAYTVRITEANQILLNSIPAIINSSEEVSATSVFSLLPSIYTTKAVITVTSDNINKLMSHSDPLLAEMFEEMNAMLNNVAEDIRKMK